MFEIEKILEVKNLDNQEQKKMLFTNLSYRGKTIQGKMFFKE